MRLRHGLPPGVDRGQSVGAQVPPEVVASQGVVGRYRRAGWVPDSTPLWPVARRSSSVPLRSTACNRRCAFQKSREKGAGRDSTLLRCRSERYLQARAFGWASTREPTRLRFDLHFNDIGVRTFVHSGAPREIRSPNGESRRRFGGGIGRPGDVDQSAAFASQNSASLDGRSAMSESIKNWKQFWL